MPRTNKGGSALECDPLAPGPVACRRNRIESIQGALNGHLRPRRSPPLHVAHDVYTYEPCDLYPRRGGCVKTRTGRFGNWHTRAMGRSAACTARTNEEGCACVRARRCGRLAQERPPSKAHDQALCLVVKTMVGAPRFELGTSRTRTVRSTGLS